MERDFSALIITNQEKNAKLSKLQKSFNDYITKIDTLKKQFDDIEVQANKIREKIKQTILPIEDVLVERRIKYITLFTDGLDTFKLSQKEREFATDFILEQIHELIVYYGKKDLIQLYDKYNEITFEQEAQNKRDHLKQQAEFFYNAFSNNDEKVNFSEMSDEEFMSSFFEKSFEMEEQQSSFRNNRKKTAKQIEAEAKRQAEHDIMNKSIRTIYTELAKELHPDLEPDAEKREKKNQIMQRLTIAYNEKNLFELLRLQIEFKQLEQGTSEIPDERLEIYIKVLKEQAAALRKQIKDKIENYPDEKISQFGLGGTPQQISYKITKHKKELQKDIEKFTNRIEGDYFKSQKAFKSYIKDLKEKIEGQMDENSIFAQLINNLMGNK